MVMSLLESLYKSLYKNVKDPALSIFRSPWRPEKSCVFEATVLDPIAVSWRARPRYPLSCPYRTRPAAFCSYHGGRRKVASSRPPFSTPLRSLGEPDPETPFLVPIEHAPPLFVRIREDKISLKIYPAPLRWWPDTLLRPTSIGE